MPRRRTVHTLQGFEPIADRHARLLILGSMPGAASLAAAQYYAHPRNGFWPILDTVWGIPAAANYADRTRAVREAGIAVWDVLHGCVRRTSLDSDIEPDSIIANDFDDFFHTHPGIRRIAFNGGGAAALYRRHVLPALPHPWCDLPTLQLPSTSPANARLTLEDKRRAWSVLGMIAAD